MIERVHQRVNFFPIFDDWVTINVYSGYKYLDKTLISLRPTILQLLERKVINLFFFTRYNDPDSHIRLRFKIRTGEERQLFLTLKEHFKRAIDYSVIWRITISGYDREVVRYGKFSIDIVEEIFFQCSLFIITKLESYENRLQLSLLLYNVLVNSIGLDLNEKLRLCRIVKERFMAEYDFTKEVKQNLGKKFITYENDFRLVLENQNSEDYTAICNVLKPLCIKLHDSFKICSQDVIEKMISIVHMNFNRIFINNARKNEAVIYYILDRYYSKVFHWK